MTDVATRIRYAHARLTGTAPQTIPIPYELKCGCGHALTGQRKTTWIQDSCAECGEVHFILPVNVYPTCRRVPSLVLGGKFLKKLRIVAAELITGGIPSSAAAEAGSTAGEDYAPPKRAPDAEKATAKSRRRLLPQFRLPRISLSFLNPLPLVRRALTPLRLLILSAVLVAVATSWWMIHQNRLEDARATWRSSMDAVTAALEAEDLAELQNHLKQAVAAADVLARRDDDVRHAENLLRQTNAVLQLSSVDLMTEFQQIQAADRDERTDLLKRTERVLTKDWFVFDCRLRSVSAAAGYAELDVPVRIDDLRVTFLIWSPWLISAQQLDSKHAVLLAAQVERVRLSDDDTGRIEVHLNADSATLMTSELHCAAVGFPVDSDDFRNRLSMHDAFVRQQERAVSAESTPSSEAGG